MFNRKVVTVFLLLGGVAAGFHVLSSRQQPEKIYEPTIIWTEPAIPCPWRDAEIDLTNWFSGATRYSAQDLILSGKRTFLQEQLGRAPRPDEMALHLYVVAGNATPLGAVLTRRIKAEHGAIEFALALDPERRIQAFKIQRIREPEEIVHAMDGYRLSDRLRGLAVHGNFDGVLRDDESSGSDAGRIAQTIIDEVKALLILFEAGHTELRVPHH